MSLIKNLNKSYGDFSLQINDWELADQGITVLWGDSGAGKTTLLKILCGLEECPGFEWWMHGTNVALLPAPERNVGVVFQHLALFPHLTARENILFPLAVQKKFKNKTNSLEKIVNLLHLGSFLDKPTVVLSGGEKQRVALARALIAEPQILIMDEPFTALDHQLKKQARKLVEMVAQERKIPLLLITHDPLDAEHMAQRVVILEKGRIKASQTTQDFLKSLQ